MSATDPSSRSFPLVPNRAARAVLTIVRGPGEGAQIRLRRTVTLMGSRAGCKVRLKHSRVDPVHCAIVNTGSDLFARDLLSKHKTLWNDLPVECEKLRDGDVLTLGQWDVRVSIERPADVNGDAGMIDLEPAQGMAVQVAGNGQLVKLRREVNVIGRRPGCDVCVQHPRVSRSHALIATVVGQPMVFDLLSSAGLTLNQQPVFHSGIHSGDRLGVASVTLRIVIPDGPRRESSPEADLADSEFESTVIRLEDSDDKIDIRAAESDPRARP